MLYKNDRAFCVCTTLHKYFSHDPHLPWKVAAVIIPIFTKEETEPEVKFLAQDYTAAKYLPQDLNSGVPDSKSSV